MRAQEAQLILAAASALLAACHDVVSFELPQVPDGARAALYLFETSDEDGELYAVDAAGADIPPPSPFTGRAQAIDVLYYDVELAAMQIDPGKVENGVVHPRPLPKSASTFRATTDGASFTPFERITMRSPALEKKRIEGTTREDCFAAGGCFANQDDAQRNDCSLPCGAIELSESTLEKPRFDDCPNGWRHGMRGAYAVCEPPPRRDPRCPDGQVQPIDGETCVPLGPPCDATDPWNSTLSSRTGRIIYVLAGAAGPGSGTRADPFARIEDGLALAGSGERVALSKGAFSGTFGVPAGVTVIGACPAETALTGGLSLLGEGARIESLRVDSDTSAVEINGAGAMTVENVLLVARRAKSSRGIRMVLGALDAKNLVATGWENALSRDGRAGTLSIARAVLLDSTSTTVLLHGPADVSIEDSVVGEGGSLGLLYDVQDGPSPDTQTTIVRSLFYKNGDTEVNVGGGSLTLTDIVSRDTSDSSVFGDGVYFAFGAIQISRSLFERHHHSAIWVFDCTASIEDVVIDDLARGFGIDLQEAHTTVARAAIMNTQSGVQVDKGDVHTDGILIDHACTGVGIFSADADLRRTIARNMICDPDMSSAGLLLGRTIDSNRDSSLVLEEFLFEHCNDIALDLRIGHVTSVRNGKIRDNTVGVWLSCDPIEDLFESVEVVRNGESFRRDCR